MYRLRGDNMQTVNSLKSKPQLITKILYSERGIIQVKGPVTQDCLRNLVMCEGLSRFRRPHEQHLALIDIAGLPEGLVFVAQNEDTIVGYITFHYPEFERWAQSGMACLLELGALEVSRHWRGLGISKELVSIPFVTGSLEDRIIVSLECYWCWDLQNTNLALFEYRDMMEKLLAAPGFVTKTTDDPDIACHPANLLSVRIGSQVSEEDIHSFERLRFKGKWLI